MTLLLAIVALAGLAWLAVFVLRGSLVAGGMLFVVVAACFGFHFMQFDVGPIPLTLDRLFVLLLGGMYVVQRRMGKTQPKPLDRLDLLIFAFLALVTASTFTHDWHASFNKDVVPLWRLIAGYLVPFAVYWVVRQARLTRSNVLWVHGALALFGLYLAVTGILEITQQWSLVFPRHIADPKLGLHFGRARGPMLHAATFGLCLTIGMLALLVCLPRGGRVAKALMLSTLPLFLASIYFSYTRTVWLGAMMSLFILLWMTLSGPRRVLILASVAAACLLVGLTHWEQLVALKRDSSASETKSSTVMRASFTYVSWQMFLDHPLWGCGFGHFPVAKRDYLADRSTSLPLEAIWHEAHHNVFLSLLTETGIFGMLLFMAILWTWGRGAWRLWYDRSLPDWMRWHGLLMACSLGAYGLSLLFFELTYSPVDNAIVFYLAGITAGLRSLAGHAHRVQLPGLLGLWTAGSQQSAGLTANG